MTTHHASIRACAKFLFVLLVYVFLTLPTVAQTTQWSAGDATDPTNWHDADNWNNGVPTASSDVQFRGTGAGGPVDLYGTSVTVNNVTQSYFGPDRSNPAIVQSTGGPATINFNEWTVIERKSGMTFKVDMNGGLFEATRKAFPQFFDGMLTLTDGNSGPNQEGWTLNGGGMFPNGFDVTYQPIAIGGGPTLHANSVVNFGPGPAGALNIGDLGTYNANVDGSMGGPGAVIDIADGGKLLVNSSQSGAGTVNVNTGAGGPQSGVTEGYALFDAAGINLANLNVNTPFTAATSGAEISSGNDVAITGALSGGGAWGGDGTMTVGGIVAPGNGIGTLAGTNLKMADGATYQLEISDPDGGAGIGWDVLVVDDMSFDGNWTLDVTDAGLTRDIDTSESFLIATLGTTNFDPAGATIGTPADWYVGDDALWLDANGNLMLSNISNLAQAVPEPSTFALALFSLVGFAVITRRRKR